LEGERLSAELEAAKSRLTELESQGLEGGESERGRRELGDETLLKLKVYRSLGIEIDDGENGKDGYKRAVVRNGTKGDVHVVNIDPKFSRFFYANYFWGSL
jgi:kinetochore protein Spc24, fungi type